MLLGLMTVSATSAKVLCSAQTGTRKRLQEVSTATQQHYKHKHSGLHSVCFAGTNIHISQNEGKYFSVECWENRKTKV